MRQGFSLLIFFGIMTSLFWKPEKKMANRFFFFCFFFFFFLFDCMNWFGFFIFFIDLKEGIWNQLQRLHHGENSSFHYFSFYLKKKKTISTCKTLKKKKKKSWIIDKLIRFKSHCKERAIEARRKILQNKRSNVPDQEMEVWFIIPKFLIDSESQSKKLKLKLKLKLK